MKIKKILSVFLAFVMMFSTAVIAYAEEPQFNMYIATSGSTNIARGESTKLFAIYDYKNCDNIELVWSTDNDFCKIEDLKDKETGLAAGAKITGLEEGKCTITVDMVSEDGEVIQSASQTVEILNFREKAEYEMSSMGFSFMFIIYLILDFILVPFGWLSGLLN